MSAIEQLGRKHISFLVSVGEFLSANGDNRNVLMNRLGLSRSDLSKAVKLVKVKNLIGNCNTVVSALTIYQNEQDNIRNKTVGKSITQKELEAKRLKDELENDSFNSHRSMTDL